MINFFYGIGLVFLLAFIGAGFGFIGIKINEYYGGFAAFLYVVGAVAVFVLHWRRSSTVDRPPRS